MIPFTSLDAATSPQAGANLTALTGGSAPTVTASVGSSLDR